MGEVTLESLFINRLVVCACGHPMDRHGPLGCTGDTRTRCECVRDEVRALDAAIDAARNAPWGNKSPSDDDPAASGDSEP